MNWSQETSIGRTSKAGAPRPKSASLRPIGFLAGDSLAGSDSFAMPEISTQDLEHAPPPRPVPSRKPVEWWQVHDGAAGEAAYSFSEPEPASSSASIPPVAHEEVLTLDVQDEPPLWETWE